jgi:hypothetical protein
MSCHPQATRSIVILLPNFIRYGHTIAHFDLLMPKNKICINEPTITLLIHCIDCFQHLTSNQRIITIYIHNDIPLLTMISNHDIFIPQSPHILFMLHYGCPIGQTWSEGHNRPHNIQSTVIRSIISQHQVKISIVLPDNTVKKLLVLIVFLYDIPTSSNQADGFLIILTNTIHGII